MGIVTQPQGGPGASSVNDRRLLWSVGFAVMAFVAWLAMRWANSDALFITLIGVQVVSCAVAALLAGAYLRRTWPPRGRGPMFMWLVLLSTSAWLVFVLGLLTFLRTVADD